MPGVRRLERLRFGSLSGRASVRQHAEIVRLATAGEATQTAAQVRENWLSLGALIDRTFARDDDAEEGAGRVSDAREGAGRRSDAEEGASRGVGVGVGGRGRRGGPQHDEQEELR
jgi:hypothetical protein